AGSGQVGRPHFAKVLYYKGHVKNTRSAFKKYLKQGASAYVDKFRFQPEEAIELIRNAGGIPVLAHPSTLNCKKKTDLQELIAGLVDIGLMGLEVYYPDHKKEQVEFYNSLAAAHSLLMTGGSDFHGKQLNGIDLGTGRGKLNVPYSLLEVMKHQLRCPSPASRIDSPPRY
ncbi:MAG: PHP domain-containing protein, partial [Deltaproteobacteria bacterium]|nr:PHP domain-containing protein [Deltaproteobacteria bacterium]